MIVRKRTEGAAADKIGGGFFLALISPLAAATSVPPRDYVQGRPGARFFIFFTG